MEPEEQLLPEEIILATILPSLARQVNKSIREKAFRDYVRTINKTASFKDCRYYILRQLDTPLYIYMNHTRSATLNFTRGVAVIESHIFKPSLPFGHCVIFDHITTLTLSDEIVSDTYTITSFNNDAKTDPIIKNVIYTSGSEDSLMKLVGQMRHFSKIYDIRDARIRIGYYDTYKMLQNIFKDLRSENPSVFDEEMQKYILELLDNDYANMNPAMFAEWLNYNLYHLSGTKINVRIIHKFPDWNRATTQRDTYPTNYSNYVILRDMLQDRFLN